MSVMTPHESLVAVGKDSGITPLGYICWWFVPDGDVSLSKLRTSWVDAGLNPQPLPKQTRDSDLFRRAVRGEEGRRETDDGKIVETDVRDIPTNDSFITYQVSRVVKDSDNRVVDYPKALRVRYGRFTFQVEFDQLGEGTDDMVASIRSRYERMQGTVTGNKVRSLIREYLTNDTDPKSGLVGLSAESMRPSGGVYFVLHRHAAELDSLGKFVDALYADHSGREAAVCTVPMADGASEREMVRRAHVANSVTEIKKAISEGRDLLRDDRKRAVTDNTKSHHFQKMARLKQHAADYAAALNDEQEELNDALDLLSEQLNRLVAA